MVYYHLLTNCPDESGQCVLAWGRCLLMSRLIAQLLLPIMSMCVHGCGSVGTSDSSLHG